MKMIRDKNILEVSPVLGMLTRAEFEPTIQALQKQLAQKDAQLEQEIARRQKAEKELRDNEMLQTISLALRRARTSRQIAQTLLTTTREISQADGGALFVCDKETLKPLFSIRADGETVEPQFSPAPELIRHVRLTGQSLFMPELPLPYTGVGEIATAIIPLKAVETVIGMLQLSFTHRHEFAEAEHHLLTAVAEIAGNALHRSLMVETLEQRVADRTRELAALYDVTVLASGDQELEELLQKSLDKILEAGKCEAVCIHLLGQNKKGLRLIANKGLPTHTNMSEILPSQVNAHDWNDVKDNKPVIISDLTIHPDQSSEIRAAGFRSYLGAPMRVKGQVLGILSLFWKNRRYLALEEIVLLSTIADQMGVAVEISHLRQHIATAAMIEERQRLARELHDSVTQSLYSQILFARTAQDALEDGDPAKLIENLTKLDENALYALKEMRLLLYELRPSILEQEGLVRALSTRLSTVERRVGVAVQFQADVTTVKFPTRVEGELYRIAIEALNNALKHAQAGLVSVYLGCQGRQVELVVADNGRGFNCDEMNECSMGLRMMRERAEKIGGRLAISSTPGQGTTVVVSVEIIE